MTYRSNAYQPSQVEREMVRLISLAAFEVEDAQAKGEDISGYLRIQAAIEGAAEHLIALSTRKRDASSAPAALLETLAHWDFCRQVSTVEMVCDCGVLQAVAAYAKMSLPPSSI